MSLLDILFPKQCLECGANGKYICAQCLSKVPRAWDRNLNTHSLWQYKGVVRKAILKLKYNFAYDIADELSQGFIKELKNSKYRTMVNQQIKNCVLVPIPLHKKRENWRGFNQANILGNTIATGLSWKYEDKLLTRKLASIQQVGLHKDERLRNMRGKFAVNKSTALSLRSTNQIFVFDDVYTTGATMNEALNVLKEAGFKNVRGLTICG